MQSPRLQSLAARFTPRGLRTSYQRSSSVSSTDSAGRSSYMSGRSESSSPIDVVNSVISRQKSVIDLEEERKAFASELDILEPRPRVYFCSLEEQMASL